MNVRRTAVSIERITMKRILLLVVLAVAAAAVSGRISGLPWA
jgi:hypothetical protein